uniref:Uncharacterized protein n=1 Tax=Glossina palpalis gambiensis TaxID=67801 RepID=A0A1B0BFI3_9MUSC
MFSLNDTVIMSKVSPYSAITTQTDNKASTELNFNQKQQSLMSTTWMIEQPTLVDLREKGDKVYMYFIGVVNYKHVSWMSERQFHDELLKSCDKYVDQDSNQYLPWISKLDIEREHIKLREQTTAARMAANNAHNSSASLRW